MLNVGKKIREIRLKKQMTQEEVAMRTDLSAAYISQLETGKTSINIETLNSLVTVLGSSLAEFFATEEKEAIIYRKQDIYKVTSEEYDIDWLISDSSKRSMEPIIIDIKKGGESEVIGVFNGEAFGYVLEGSCILFYAEDTYSLNKGDSFYVKGTKEHKISCNKESTRILWVTNPPYF